MRTETDEFSFILRPSLIPDAGIGVFATHDIAKETILWLYPKTSTEEIQWLAEIWDPFIRKGEYPKDPQAIVAIEKYYRLIPKDSPLLTDPRTQEHMSRYIVSFGDYYLGPLAFNRMSISSYINHSETPNIKKRNFFVWCSSKDIKAEEELTTDYRLLSPGTTSPL